MQHREISPEGHSAITGNVNAMRAHDDVVQPDLLGVGKCKPDVICRDNRRLYRRSLCTARYFLKGPVPSQAMSTPHNA